MSTASRSTFLVGAAASVALAGLPRGVAATLAQLSDLRLAWDTLLDVGPAPFRTAQRAMVEATRDAAYAELERATTASQAWLAVAPVFAALNDAHVGVVNLALPVPSHGRFPLTLAFDERNDIIVVNDLTGRVPRGSRLIALGNIDDRTLRDRAMRCYGAQNESLKRARAAGNIANVLDAGFALDLALKATFIAGGITSTVELTAAAVPTADAVAPYALRWSPDERTAIIDYRACQDAEGMRAFCAATFAKLRTEGTRSLIVDVRANGGGNSNVNDVLIAYLSGKPYRQFGGSLVRSSPYLKRLYGRAKYVTIYGSAAWAAPDGEIVTYGASREIVPSHVADRFEGRVYILAGLKTFSSAMAFVAAARMYDLAVVVGEPTGEPANSTGEVYSLPLPSTGLAVSLTTKYFMAPRPTGDGSGVEPHIAVSTTLEDRLAGRDPVMARALSLAREGAA